MATKAKKNRTPEDILTDLVIRKMQAKEAMEMADAEIRDFMETNNLTEVDLPDWRVTYKAGAPSKRFDKTAFEKDHPGMYEEYVKVGATPKPTLRTDRKNKA